MKYGKMTWRNCGAEAPAETYIVLDDDRLEVEKIEVFHNGSVGYADSSTTIGSTFLSDLPYPEFSAINSSPEMKKEGIEYIYLTEAQYREKKAQLVKGS